MIRSTLHPSPPENRKKYLGDLEGQKLRISSTRQWFSATDADGTNATYLIFWGSF